MLRTTPRHWMLHLRPESVAVTAQNKPDPTGIENTSRLSRHRQYDISNIVVRYS